MTLSVLLEKIQQSPFDCFIVLYFLNLILDYPLQGEFLATYKSKNNYILFVHSAIWGIGIVLGLLVFNLYGDYGWWKFFFLIFGHMIIDAWKCRGWYKKMNISDWHSLYIDQILHVIQIIICIVIV